MGDWEKENTKKKKDGERRMKFVRWNKEGKMGG